MPGFAVFFANRQTDFLVYFCSLFPLLKIIKKKRIIQQRISTMCSSPRTVRVTLTNTDPSRFLATHSYSAVCSFWALLILRELFDKVEKWSLPSRGRPWRDHSIAGVGSPSAWQSSTTVVPASTTVFTGSIMMEGAPGRKDQSHVISSSKYFHTLFTILM